MKYFVTGVTALLAVVCLHDTASAQSKVTWAPGYPSKGSLKGEIIVKGVIAVKPGNTPNSEGVFHAWQDGSFQTTGSVKIFRTGAPNVFKWQGTISGLTSSATYNVVVEVGITNSMMTPLGSLRTAPAVSTAK